MAQTPKDKKTAVNLADKAIDTQLSILGRESHDFHGFVNPPVVRASTVLYPDAESMELPVGHPDRPRYTYAIHATPTTDGLTQAINVLEEAYDTVLVPSGLAAVTLPLLACAKPGRRVLVPDNVYGPTRRFCGQCLAQLGMDVVFYDPLIGSGIADLMLPNGQTILFAEAPGSYTFEMPDLAAFLEASAANDAITMIDNTWATPLIYKPLIEGFDYSIQAGTKYYGGHSDLLIGSVSSTEKAWPMLKRMHLNLGLQAGTEEVFLTLRGIRTLRLRLDQHEKTALELAQWLETQPFVTRVLHPALPSDPGHALWKKLFKGRASGLFGVEVNGSADQARTMLNTFQLFGLGYSWGGFESLAVLGQLDQARTARPWTGGPLVRLQIGLEDVNDLKADLLAGAEAAELLTT